MVKQKNRTMGLLLVFDCQITSFENSIPVCSGDIRMLLDYLGKLRVISAEHNAAPLCHPTGSLRPPEVQGNHWAVND